MFNNNLHYFIVNWPFPLVAVELLDSVFTGWMFSVSSGRLKLITLTVFIWELDSCSIRFDLVHMSVRWWKKLEKIEFEHFEPSQTTELVSMIKQYSTMIPQLFSNNFVLESLWDYRVCG